MIVDVHTHVFRPESEFGPRLMGDLQRCGIQYSNWGNVAERHLATTGVADVAIVFGLKAAATGWNVSNDFVAAHARRAPERLLFFAAIDPGQLNFQEDLERCHRELDCCGIKLAPIYQGVHPLDKRCYEVYSYCEKHGLPVLTHMATTFSSGTPLEYARPAHMDQVAIDFPELRMVLAHLGHPWEGETLAVIRRNQHIYADISALYYRPWQFYNSLRLAVEYRTDSKILFGSDFPFTTTADSLAGLRNVNAITGTSGLPAIPVETIEGIIHRDALSLLGLPLPARVNT